MRSRLAIISCFGAAILTTVLPSAASAQDFFAALFGGFSRPQRQMQRDDRPMAFGDPFFQERAPAPRYGGGSAAYCVRSCDGRFFPVPGAESGNREAACNSFCPASETKVFYGRTIDNAVNDNGKSYSDIPNAFKYRNELVSNCTCNGKDSVGLASVKIENDPTLRKGDIVAGDNGLVVAARSADKRRAMNFSPAPSSVRARYDRVVTSE